jgi:NAD(P)-dependent dehydrogenase (short-subunit alcohol dehydrogenase family)
VQDLYGKVAFITGGGSGVGLGQAKVFAEAAGMRVVIADVRNDRLDEAVGYFRTKKVQILPLLLDITDRAAYARAADEVERTFGPVQLLMNTAGVSERIPVEQATYEDWDWHIDVNLKGVINGVQTFLPRMIQHGRGGHIVNTASTSAFFAKPTAALYATTKFAVRGLSESLRIELDKYDIGVSCLCMGAVNTNILESGANRPEKYRRTSSQGDDHEAIAQLKKFLEAGFDPVDLAEIVLEGVKRNDLWIFPHPEYASRIEEKSKELIESMNSWANYPAVARRIKGLKQPSKDLAAGS